MITTVGEISARRKTIILASCCLSLLIVSMDSTIVNVAIPPAIRTDLHATASQMQWVIDIYTLVLASLLMLSGATGDRFGRRRIFQIGLATFAVGSLLCSLAPDIDTLIGARLVQGFGGSMMNPVALSIISQIFVGRVERARALGLWGGAVVGISMALGPIVGGFLIERSAGARCSGSICPSARPPSSSRRSSSPPRASRPPCAISIRSGSCWPCWRCSASSSSSSRAGNGLDQPADPAIAAGAAVALLAFLRYESRRHDPPFIDLRFFRSVPFSSATVIAVCAFAAWGGPSSS